MRIHYFLLSIFALIFIVRYVVHLVREYRKTEDKRRFWTIRRFRYAIMLALVIGIPILLARLIFPLFFPEIWHHTHDIELETLWWISVPVSLLISLVWLIFMYRLDIFEREEWLYLIIYLSFGLSRYKIVPDRLNPFRVPFDFLIPKPKVVKQEVAAIAKEESSE